MHYKLLRLVQHQSKQHETNSILQMFINLVIRKGKAYHVRLLFNDFVTQLLGLTVVLVFQVTLAL